MYLIVFWTSWMWQTLRPMAVFDAITRMKWREDAGKLAVDFAVRTMYVTCDENKTLWKNTRLDHHLELNISCLLMNSGIAIGSITFFSSIAAQFADEHKRRNENNSITYELALHHLSLRDYVCMRRRFWKIQNVVTVKFILLQLL